MARELRIEAVLPLPDDIFAEAGKIAAVESVIGSLRTALESDGGTVAVSCVTPKPRNPEGATRLPLPQTAE
jgi:hypothetical protein